MDTDKILINVKDNNSWEYNHLKAVEELTELSEVLIKKVNKKGGPKEPTNQEIIDELGDVLIRIEILMQIYGDWEVYDRRDFKLLKFEGYLNEGKYKGSI